jgi:hypothetical protein
MPAVKPLLGPNQIDTLWFLREFGWWRRDPIPPFVMDSPSKTERILDSLVKHKLVRKSQSGIYRPVPDETPQT